MSSTNQTNNNNNNNHLETIISVQYGDIILSDVVLENLKSLDEALERDQVKPTTKPLIQRVPSTLRKVCNLKDFRKYFEPRVISIGPIHHGDPTLHGSDKLKLLLAAHFVKNHDVEKAILYNNIKTEIATLKKCYDPMELKQYCDDDDEKLAWMFFLDGCAVLQAIYLRHGTDMEDKDSSTDNMSTEKLIIKNDLLTFVYLDLFLLQNQLPYRVLELLTGSTIKGRMFMDSITKFIDENVITPSEMKQQQQQQQQQQKQQGREPVHLLDLLRKRLVSTEKTGNPSENRGLCVRLFRYMNKREPKTHHSHTFRNVKELRSAGIWLKPSDTSCLKDISFNRVCCKGKLWLPPITVDDSTGPKFMNLIAYEMCPDFDNDFIVTSYICFLDSLIDEPEDVKELRDAGILYNGLGSDEEVAKLFNKMNTDLVPNPFIYSDVKMQIHNHCRNTWIHYAAQAYYTHFNSPWTFLAFVGAIVALLLSAIQTYYAMQSANQESSTNKN